MKISQTRPIPARRSRQINKAHPNNKMGEWMKNFERISYQEIANANNSFRSRARK